MLHAAMHDHSDLGLAVYLLLMIKAHQLCASRACNQIASESLADLRIDDNAVRTYAATLDVAEVCSAAEQPRLPIRFDSQQSEVRGRLSCRSPVGAYADLVPVLLQHTSVHI